MMMSNEHDLPDDWRWCQHKGLQDCAWCHKQAWPMQDAKQVVERQIGGTWKNRSEHYHTSCALERALSYIATTKPRPIRFKWIPKEPPT